MRTHLIIPAVLVGCALGAQAPATLDVQYNDALPAVRQALEEARFKVAADRMEALANRPLPLFRGETDADISRSTRDGSGMLGILGMQAKVQGAMGEWETSRETSLKAVAFGRKLTVDVKAALAVRELHYRQEAEAADAYAKANGPKAKDIEGRLQALQAEIKAFNAKQVKLSPQELEDLKARAAKAPAEEQQLQEIRQHLAEGAVAGQRLRQFQTASSGFASGIEKQVADAEAFAARQEDLVKQQTGEIESFNRKHASKKHGAADAKAWVAAVIKNPANLSKFRSVGEQATFLYRLHVLDRDNEAVNRALANVEAGRDPLYQERPVKGGRRKH
nr:hypothetical protein [uncultured Holophaga sp.]